MKKPHKRLFYAVFNWWVRWGSNPRPRDYESPALTPELQTLHAAWAAKRGILAAIAAEDKGGGNFIGKRPSENEVSTTLKLSDGLFLPYHRVTGLYRIRFGFAPSSPKRRFLSASYS